MNPEQHGPELPESWHSLDENVFTQDQLQIVLIKELNERSVVGEILVGAVDRLISLLSLVLAVVFVYVVVKWVDPSITRCYGMPPCSRSIGGLSMRLLQL